MWARSYTVRAVLALVFLVGFYLVAIALAVGLLALPYLEYVTVGRVHFYVAGICLATGAVILWSLIPRRASWEDPGPRITAAQHPRLFERIAGIAGQMRVAMPAEVFLIPEMNAFVTERGGFLGFGARRVMAIGVPLLAIENVSQLDATIAHELGHYVGGETRLSGIVYATRRAMIMTLAQLEAHSYGIFQAPFRFMLKIYMRITQAISRQQELLADSWSVRLAGREAHVTGLGLEHTHGVALQVFLRSEVEPLVRSGRVPVNVFDGYRRFVGSPGFARLGPELARIGEEAVADPYDSHPSLAERVAFAATVESGPAVMDTTPAHTLLSDAAKVEADLSSTLTPDGLESVSWDALGEVWASVWRTSAVRLAVAEPGFDIAALERALTDAAETARIAEAVVPRLRGYQLPDRSERTRAAVAEFGAAWLAVLLGEHGWTWSAELGEPVLLKHGDVALDVRARLADVVEGRAPSGSLRAIAPEILRDGVTLALAASEQPRVSADPPAILCTRGERASVVSGRLPDLVVPACCAVCTGPVQDQYAVKIAKEGFSVGESGLVLHLFGCTRHARDLGEALRLRRHDKVTDEVVLVVRSGAYAELMARASEKVS